MSPHSAMAAGFVATMIVGGCQNSALTGQQSPPASDTHFCADLIQAWQLSILALGSAPGSCALDDDCTLVTEQVACNDAGTQLEECPIVVAASMAQSVSQQLSNFRADFCAMHCGIGGSAQCKPITAGCVQGVCRGVEPGR